MNKKAELDWRVQEIIHLACLMEPPLLKAIRRHWEKTGHPDWAGKKYINLVFSLVIEKRREKEETKNGEETEPDYFFR